MTAEIQQELLKLEAQHQIKILYAVESGSRAWGFASADSDWDVRYIYIHQQDWYLDIDPHKDTLEEILPNDIDLSGWELKKALRLLRKSNPSLLEWLHSPIVYQQQGWAIDRLRQLGSSFFFPKAILYHYYSMADTNYQNYLLGDTVRVKKYFYVLRPLLACEWIRNTGTMAPMEFRQLLDTQLPDVAVKAEVEKLLVRKMAGDELAKEPPIPMLHNYLVQLLDFYSQYVKSITPTPPPDSTLLNDFFRQALKQAWQ